MPKLVRHISASLEGSYAMRHKSLAGAGSAIMSHTGASSALARHFGAAR
jgi:hypothetical protein